MATDRLSVEDVQRIKAELDSKTFVDDVIARIIVSLPTKKMPADPERLHVAFKELKDKHEELAGIPFSRGDEFPFSRVLEKVLFRLEMSGLITLRNPVYDVYEISDDVRAAIKKKVLSRTGPQNEKKYDIIAAELQEKLT